jgi:hypothetical protein
VATRTHDFAFGDFYEQSIYRDADMGRSADTELLGATHMIEVHGTCWERSIAVDTWSRFEFVDDGLSLIAPTRMGFSDLGESSPAVLAVPLFMVLGLTSAAFRAPPVSFLGKRGFVLLYATACAGSHSVLIASTSTINTSADLNEQRMQELHAGV